MTANTILLIAIIIVALVIFIFYFGKPLYMKFVFGSYIKTEMKKAADALTVGLEDEKNVERININTYYNWTFMFTEFPDIRRDLLTTPEAYEAWKKYFGEINPETGISIDDISVQKYVIPELNKINNTSYKIDNIDQANYSYHNRYMEGHPIGIFDPTYYCPWHPYKD